MTTMYVSGILTAVSHRQGGWIRAEIEEPGKQYPRKLDTKKPELVQAAQSMVGQPVTAMYNEVDSGNPNPNRPGTNYINRYLEQISLGFTDVSGYNPQPTHAQPQQRQGAAPQVQQRAQPQGDPEKDKRITRMACLKASSQLLMVLGVDDQNLASLMRINEQLVKYVYEGLPYEVPQAHNETHANDPVGNPGHYSGQQPEEYAGDPGAQWEADPHGFPTDY